LMIISSTTVPRRWLVAIVIAGLLLRYALRFYSTPDTFYFLLPWYEFARDHGIGSLGFAYTNYTPFYSYLLIAVAQFDGLAPPLLLIKSISFVFEFASAVVAYELAYYATKNPAWSTGAFGAAWLAPTVIANGAMWGQCDAIWSFFLLLSIYLFCRGRQGTLPFAVGFAVKAQGIFLAPFVLGMLLRRRWQWVWLATIPLVYVILALPAIVAGAPVRQVLGVYLNQGATFHSLSMNAANPWIFVPDEFYRAGVLVGLTLASVAGLVITAVVARSRKANPEFIVVAACASLLLMPYLLPKMHERYFYAFELASLCLACINPRYIALAIVAQVDGVLSYLPYDRQWQVHYDVFAAALGNTLLALFLLRQFFGKDQPSKLVTPHLVGYVALCAGFGGFLAYLYVVRQPSTTTTTIIGTLFCGLLTIQVYRMLGHGRRLAV
jgi:Gpi18-like mannosyltransferase